MKEIFMNPRLIMVIICLAAGVFCFGPIGLIIGAIAGVLISAILDL